MRPKYFVIVFGLCVCFAGLPALAQADNHATPNSYQNVPSVMFPTSSPSSQPASIPSVTMQVIDPAQNEKEANDTKNIDSDTKLETQELGLPPTDSDVDSSVLPGTLRLVSASTILPTQYFWSGLVQTDARGRVLPAIAESWRYNDDYTWWEFKIRSGLNFAEDANGILKEIKPSDVAISLISTRTTDDLPVAIKSIDIEGQYVSIELETADTLFLRRMSHPATGIRGPNQEMSGPYVLHSLDSKIAVLKKNPESVLKSKSETVVIYFEPRTPQGVFMVEAGLADIARVGDDDLMRLAAEKNRRTKLVHSNAREVHALIPLTISDSDASLIQNSIDRETLLRHLLNRRGNTMGENYIPISVADAKRLGKVVILYDVGLGSYYERLFQRISFDFASSGCDVEFMAVRPSNHFETDHSRALAGVSDAMVMQYVVASKEEIPADALGLFSLVPYWAVNLQIQDFSPPRTGYVALTQTSISR
ncbi:MAG: hypothetical protein JKX97_04100 [Candidatus Lindowbacteria bacterium]|nr:hypothetical protein [Candidatus Lindowbacteria bacterium]